MPFIFESLKIPEVYLIKPKKFQDSRGYFMEFFKKSEFEKNGISHSFIQDNFSYSKKNVLRGLHYQTAPYSQAKMVHCLRGQIFDVAVDLRPKSKTFGQWVSTILSEDNHHILYIPEGFGHGFFTLSEDALVLYKASKEYAPNADKGLIYNDKSIDIKWPFSDKPILSEKDKLHPELKDIEF